ncbi:Transposon Ty3-G Gag-Pol polyprotein [Vitis vinifera]|uniref:Transposon Ty3-G Gag-Pol polyprotein n=1 Tax=Vitis vinifera TaxID=29760 RepID=A0A438HTG0_VITVI|nr:Transposon Ty3-G Gag-Pol polyprotein [Vitis vinifera]
MPGIHPSTASHRLNILPSSRPVRRKVWRFHPDRQKIIQSEVNKLLDVRFIREVEYPEWLANVVVVPKKEGRWRVCVDYTNLNNACPKDSFPLPRINQIVDSIVGHGMLSFLDAFSGYHQIPMAPADEEKTAFITPHGLYCYKVMSFGLKNTSATYQRLMTKIFKPLIGRMVEVYIDDIVVKNKTREEHTHHLQEVFHLLRRYDMRLNPSKCAFGSAFEKIKHYLTQPPILSSPQPDERLYMYIAPSDDRCGNKIFKDRTDCLSLAKRLPEAPLVFPSLPNSRTYRPAPPKHPAQTGPVQKDATMGHRFERSGGPYEPTEPPGRQVLEWVCCYNLQLTNNWSRSSGSDSPHQTTKLKYGAKDERMSQYLTKVRDTLKQLDEWTIKKVSRVDNIQADALAGITTSFSIREAILLPIQVQANPSITQSPACNAIKESQEWTSVIKEYLRTGTLPELDAIYFTVHQSSSSDLLMSLE